MQFLVHYGLSTNSYVTCSVYPKPNSYKQKSMKPYFQIFHFKDNNKITRYVRNDHFAKTALFIRLCCLSGYKYNHKHRFYAFSL